MTVTVENQLLATNITEDNQRRKLDGSSFSTDQLFYVGGIPNANMNNMKGLKANERFVGCLKNVIFKANRSE